MKKIAIVLCLVLLGTGAAIAQNGNANNSTAQAVMFDTHMSGTFLMTDTQVFSYDRQKAATFFTNTWDGVVPAGQIQGQAHGTTAPAAPAVPAPIDGKMTGSINGNQCTFWNGGTLSARGDSTYTQSLYVDVPYTNFCSQTNNKTGACSKYISGNDTYKYTYNYVVKVNSATANVPGIVNAGADYPWQLTSNSPGAPVTVTLNGYLAAETSVKKSGPNAPWHFKTGFELPNSVDPLTGQYIGVTNILATLVDPQGNVMEQRNLSNTVENGVDFNFNQNAGYNGSFSQLVDGSVLAIENGLVLAHDGVTKDDFAGNNNLGGSRAVLDPQDFVISAPGAYTLTVTGTLQGVSGALPLNFSVGENITYDTAENACPAIVL